MAMRDLMEDTLKDSKFVTEEEERTITESYISIIDHMISLIEVFAITYQNGFK